jgi:hypothetical protein
MDKVVSTYSTGQYSVVHATGYGLISLPCPVSLFLHTCRMSHVMSVRLLKEPQLPCSLRMVVRADAEVGKGLDCARLPPYTRRTFFFSLLSLVHLWLGRIAAAERGGSLLSLVQIVTRWFLG